MNGKEVVAQAGDLASSKSVLSAVKCSNHALTQSPAPSGTASAHPNEVKVTRCRAFDARHAEIEASTLLEKIRRAHAEGRHRKACYLTRQYLGALSARLSAVRRAWRKLPIYRRVPRHALLGIARSLNAFAGTSEPVVVRFIPKKSNPDILRPVMDFGLEGRALQYLVGDVLKARFPPNHNQYLTNGGYPMEAVPNANGDVP